MQVNIKLLNAHSRMPDRKTALAAGFDLYACILNADGEPCDTVIPPRSVGRVCTGIAFEPVSPEIVLTDGSNTAACVLELHIRSRSGLAAKNNVWVLNAPGTIDADYRGEIIVILANFSDEPFVVNHGDRIAQGVFNLALIPTLHLVEELGTTDRGEGGLGSTGV